MNSTETSSDPSSSSTERIDDLHRAGIDDLDSRNAEEVSLADIAGVVASLNEKICLLRREILELRDCGTVSFVRKSAQIESGNPSGLPPEDQRTVRNVGLSFMKKIASFAFFESTIARRNRSKESIVSGSFDHYGYTPSDEDLPFNYETQSGRRPVYVVGANAKSRSASPFKPDNDSTMRKQHPGKGSTAAVSGDAELISREEMKRLNEPTKINNKKKKSAAERNVRNNGGAADGGGGNDDYDGNETINSSENRSSDKEACVKRKRERTRTEKWKKSTARETTKLNKCLNTNCYGKHVRKRISRGVQTAPKKRWRIVNLLRKFRWRSRKKRSKEKVSTAGETPPKKASADMIFEPSEASARSDNNTDSNIESTDVTSETNDERKREGRILSDDLRARNYNRKYKVSSIDGKKVETIRAEENDRATKRENHKPPRNVTETGNRTDFLGKRTNAGKKRGGKTKRKEGNLSSSDVGTSADRTNEPSTDKSKPRESVKQKTDPTDGTEVIREGKKKSRKPNNEDKDARFEDEKIAKRDTNSAVEKPASVRRTKRSRNRKNSSTLKAFTDSVRNSFTQQRPSLDDKRQETDKELIGKRLDARKNDIADVKRRLDACIDDLNDIILTLSELFREATVSGGPAGEGRQNRNISRRGRSRIR